MKTAVFGSTGRVGQELVRIFAQNGQPVRALVRTPEKHIYTGSAEIIKGNVRNPEAVKESVKGCSSIISCLNTDGDDTLSAGLFTIIDAASHAGIKRIITVGTAGILKARSNPSLYRYQSDESKRRSTRAAEEHAKVYEMLLRTELNWTIACPTYLPDGKLTGSYRCEAEFLPEGGTSISVQDTADFVFKEWQNPSFIRKRAGLAY
ncbi:NAD(P)-dependent oxidoreductase [Metabacillus sp. 113a]|uniref:NAD(P)-dependent oxidoreductase n=1 Tax=Metabacillus sp. 113a TaxID=3404706 RepID=UPI003CF64254